MARRCTRSSRSISLYKGLTRAVKILRYGAIPSNTVTFFPIYPIAKHGFLKEGSSSASDVASWRLLGRLTRVNTNTRVICGKGVAGQAC